MVMVAVIVSAIRAAFAVVFVLVMLVIVAMALAVICIQGLRVRAKIPHISIVLAARPVETAS